MGTKCVASSYETGHPRIDNLIIVVAFGTQIRPYARDYKKM